MPSGTTNKKIRQAGRQKEAEKSRLKHAEEETCS
jgi:hypothetical protein